MTSIDLVRYLPTQLFISEGKGVKGPLIYEQWHEDSWRTEENYWPYKHGEEVSTPPNKWQNLQIPKDTSRVKNARCWL